MVSKMKVVVLFVSVICAAISLPTENNGPEKTDIDGRNNALEQIILDIIEDLRQLMLTGSNDIPVLDPFKLDHFHLELQPLLAIDGYITVSDVEAREISTFLVDNLSFRLTNLILQRYTLEIEGHVPVMEIDTENYEMDMSVLGLSMTGNGTLKMKVREPRIKANIVVSVGILSGISVTVREADVEVLLEDFEADMNGVVFEDFAVSEAYVKEFLSILIPDMLTFYQDEISGAISSIIMGIGTINLSNGNFLSPSTLQALENTLNA